MRMLLVVAALALISTSADAKVHNLNFGGRSVRIEVPTNCKKISCIRLDTKEKSSRKTSKSTEPVTSSPPVAAAPVAPATVAAATTAAAVPQVTAATAASKAEPKAESLPSVVDDRKPVTRLTLPPTEESKPAATQAAGTQTAATQVAAIEPKPESAQPAGPSPLGVWLTEKGEGKVRIIECGQALCGHTEGKPNEKILISMQPSSQKNRWNGKIHDIRRGGTYMAHMTLRNANSLRVEGCAFGGLFCGGQTWSRVE